MSNWDFKDETYNITIIALITIIAIIARTKIKH